MILLIQGCSGGGKKGPKAIFSNCKLEENVPYNDKEMLKFTCDYTIKGAMGHEVQLVLSVESPKGTPHYKKNGDLLENKGDPIVVNAEEYSKEGKWWGLYNSSLNPKPGKNTYYASMRAFDLTTGEIIGKTEYFKFKLRGESKPESNEPSITFYNCRIEENAPGDNGAKYLKYHYSYVITGAKGHELRKVLTIETPKGTLHRKKDGTPMEFDDNQPRLIENDNSDIKDRYYGINYNNLNLLSGKHTYYARMKIYDKGTGQLLGTSPYLTYTMTGQTNTKNNSNKKTSNSPSASFSNCRLEPNIIQNNYRALKCHYTLDANGVKGHKLKLVVSIEYPQGVLQYESRTELTTQYDSSKWENRWVAIPNQNFIEIGENIYYVRYMLYDETLGTTLASSPYMSFTQTGAAG